MSGGIILASNSAARRDMLAAAGVTFTTKSAAVDEDGIRRDCTGAGMIPRETALALARAKARDVAARHPRAVVIGADQVLDLDGSCLSKPQTHATAKAQLLRLRGRTHRLHSAAAIVENGREWTHVDSAMLTMRAFSGTYLSSYLARMADRVFATVGGYMIEAEGIRLFQKLEGDHFTVLGMPLLPVLSRLGEIGAIER